MTNTALQSLTHIPTSFNLHPYEINNTKTWFMIAVLDLIISYFEYRKHHCMRVSLISNLA